MNMRKMAALGMVLLLLPQARIHAGAQEGLPSRFDLREQGLVSPVRDQGSHGTCWAFTACSAVETAMIREDPTVDLSEWYLAYHAYNGKYAFPLLEPNKEWADQGTQFPHVPAMLSAWHGPAAEVLFPYEGEIQEDPDFSRTLFHVTDINVVHYMDPATGETEDPDAMRQYMKEQIYGGRLVGVAYVSAAQYYNAGKTNYYNPGDLESGGGHDVCIVGWDDSYPASAFKQDPGMDGAWLVKNSWGTDSCDFGYFWLSYADKSLVDWFSLDGRDARTPETMYLHDSCGQWTTYAVADTNDDTDALAASVFTAQEDGCITSAMFYTGEMGDAWTVTVYTDLLDAKDPESGTPRTSVSGTSQLTGYHTAELPDPVTVGAGDTFSVVVEYVGEPGFHIGCEVYERTVCEYSDGTAEVVQSAVSQEQMTEDFNPGESFIRLKDGEWLDMYDIGAYEIEQTFTAPEDWTPEDGAYPVSMRYSGVCGNVCVRAMVQPLDAVVFSAYNDLEPGDTVALSNAAGYPVYYSVNGKEPVLYTEALSFDGTPMEITAYADVPGRERSVYSCAYGWKKALLSGLVTAPGDGAADRKNAVCTEQLPGVYTAFCESVQGADTVTVVPSAMGTITVNGEEIPSSKAYTWHVGDAEAAKLLITVSDEGQLTSEYKLLYSSAEETLLCGDADGNGVLNAVDASMILRYAAIAGSGGDTGDYDADWLFRCDFSFDGEVSAVDASQILYYAALTGNKQ